MAALARIISVVGLVALTMAIAFTPTVVADREDRLPPAACLVSPRTASNEASPVAATPLPEASTASDNGTELLPGEAADPATVEQITAAAQKLAGCLNAVDTLRLAALLTDAAVTAGIERGQFAPLFLASGASEPGSGETPWEIAWLRVRNVQVLPDGRVRAVITWGVTEDPQLKPIPESFVQVYARVADRWLLDAALRGNLASLGGAEPADGDSPAAPDVDPILRRGTQGFTEVDSALYAEPTMAGAKFSIEALVMVGFVGNDDYAGVGCELFIFERGETTATISAYCRAEEALIGRAAYLDVSVYGPRRGSESSPTGCEDVAALADIQIFSCTVDLPEEDA